MDSAKEFWFSHEKLEVYQESIRLIAWLADTTDKVDRAGDIKDHLDRASTSVCFNIAEGNGKFSPKDRCKFFDIAHGSALECAAALDALVARRKLTLTQIRPGKMQLQKIVRMTVGLIKRNSTRDYKRSDDEPTPPSESS